MCACSNICCGWCLPRTNPQTSPLQKTPKHACNVDWTLIRSASRVYFASFCECQGKPVDHRGSFIYAFKPMSTAVHLTPPHFRVVATWFLISRRNNWPINVTSCLCLFTMNRKEISPSSLENPPSRQGKLWKSLALHCRCPTLPNARSVWTNIPAGTEREVCTVCARCTSNCVNLKAKWQVKQVNVRSHGW